MICAPSVICPFGQREVKLRDSQGTFPSETWERGRNQLTGNITPDDVVPGMVDLVNEFSYTFGL